MRSVSRHSIWFSGNENGLVQMTPSKMTSIKLKLQEKSPKDTTMTSSEKKKDKKKSEEVKENIVTK